MRTAAPDATRRHGRVRTFLSGLAATTLTAALSIVGLGATTTPAYAADPTGCGYGTGGFQASTICWLDLTDYNDAQARTAAGQPMSLTIPGGYTVSFTVKTTNVSGYPSVTAQSEDVPTWTRALIGNVVYTGTPGLPALIGSVSSQWAFHTQLEDIVVTDIGGNPVAEYGMVVADAETTGTNEEIYFNSDATLHRIDPADPNAPACYGGLTGLGTTSVHCDGEDPPSTPFTLFHTGALVLEADSPTTIGATPISAGGREGVAFAFVTTKLQVAKTVSGRVNATDSFDVSITSPESTVLETVSTGSANSVQTDVTTVLPTTSSGQYTLSEAPTAGTETLLSNYTKSWSCTNGGATYSAFTVAPNGASITLDPEPGDSIRCTVTNTAIASSLSILKSASVTDANGDGLTDAGDTIAYSFTVANTGQLTMSNITVNDPMVGTVTCLATTLIAGASTTCTASPYTITTADQTAGGVNNSATASGTPPGSTTPKASVPSTTSTPTTTPAPGISVTKSADVSTVDSAGDPIVFSFLVTNTGNVPLSNVSAVEGTFTGNGTVPTVICPGAPVTLAPGGTVTCTANYVALQSDIDDGSIANTATAVGTPPNTTAISSAPSTATVTAPASPDLTVAKSASPTVAHEAGDVISYTFVITNTGNVTLSGVTVEDTFSGSGTVAITCAPAVLSPGADRVCTGQYTVLQADVDRGSILNSAVAVGTAPGATSQTVSAADDATVTIPAAPGLTVLKTASPTTIATPGEQILYSFLITNTGNVTLADVGIQEDAFSGTGTMTISCAPATLAPGASRACAGSYDATQADINAGEIDNTASAFGTAPGATTPTLSAPSTASVDVDLAPELTLVKTASPDASQPRLAGEVITYTFHVTNTGNVTLSNVQVHEDSFSGTGGTPVVTCPAGPITMEPGDEILCTATYTVTAADAAAKKLTNTAHATGQPLVGLATLSLPSTAAVPLHVPTLAVTGHDVSNAFITGLLTLVTGGAMILTVRRARTN